MTLTLRTFAALALAVPLSTCCLAAQQPSASPSFDCARAASAREHVICSTSALAREDSRVAAAYAALLRQLSPPSAAQLRVDQRQWLHWLDQVCPAKGLGIENSDNITECLKLQYVDRLKQLHLDSHNPAGPLFTRAEFALTPAVRGDGVGRSEVSPSFGTGTFAWPQIDLPNASQRAWNQSILAASVRSVQDPKRKPPFHFIDAVDSDGALSLDASILAATPVLILSSISTFEMGYGAAHPSSGVRYHSFWMAQARELTPQDLFADKNYAAVLLPKIIAKLKADPDYGNSLFDADTVRKGVIAELADVSSWEPTRSGLTINFSQYEVGPYVIGMPSVELTWASLKPLLNATFDPATLPTLAPGKR